MVIGVSGKYCSGKNLLCSLFTAKGWAVVDVDDYAHKALERKSSEVIARFGRKICLQDGSIDRRRLGEIVFASAREMQALEAIIHPLMYSWTEKFCTERKNAVINAAVLYRMKLYKLCDKVIWVKAGLVTRIGRAMRRDGLSLARVLQRFIYQRKLKPKHLQKFVDIYTMRNDGKTDLSAALDAFLKRI